MKKLTLIGCLAAILASGATGHAIQMVIPTTVVSGVNVFSGPSFTVSGNYGLNDFVWIEAIGTVDLNVGNYTANAAGVIVAPPTTNTGNNPGQTSPALPGSPNPGAPYAALLIGNSILGFHPLFPADLSAGLNSATPPTDIFAQQTIGSLFGVAIPNGTVLEFRINDINTGDNSGSFTIKNVTVPEAWGALSSLLIPLTTWSGMLLFRKRTLAIVQLVPNNLAGK
jgi:hypothetical protein